MTVALEGGIQTRQWDDDRGMHHWKTEIVAKGCSNDGAVAHATMTSVP
jgi:single-stranded DNA-binding protein